MQVGMVRGEHIQNRCGPYARKELHEAAAGVTTPRLLPWITQDGKPWT
jgi:hypothetical protein